MSETTGSQNDSSFPRGSGLLLHITSIPSGYGIGDFGPGAWRFVDFLKKSGQKYWQVLPLNPTDPFYGNSPYSSHSAFAMNTLFISPDRLVEQGWIEKKDIPPASGFDDKRVDYQGAAAFKDKIFNVLFDRWRQQARDAAGYQQFCQANADWLEDYALFMVLKRHFSNKGWPSWDAPLRDRQPQALKDFQAQHTEKIEKEKVFQFIAQRQWQELKAYTRKQGVRIIGDIPIYVNLDSADVWAYRQFFKLDEQGNPLFVAGVPPDYFSATGQRWGNPVYDWPRLKEDDFGWWMKRLKQNFAFYDYLRIDHFRGLAGYWEIPASEPTAVNGQWVPGPGDDFFIQIQKTFSKAPIIAEDLGIITDDVKALMQKFAIPGMKVLLFAFSGDLKTHPYIPEQYTPNCVVYTGTHDNNTILGWFLKDATDEEKNNLAIYLGKKMKVGSLARELIRVAMASVAEIALIPLQDVLGLGAEARMNTPGTASGNWEWRLVADQLTPAVSKNLLRATQKCGR